MLASVGSRITARILDYTILSVAIFLALLLLILTGVMRADPTEEFSGLALVIQLFTWPPVMAPLLMLIYEPVLIAIRGRTIGKRVVAIEVVGADQGGVPGWGSSVGRILILTITSILCFISILVSDSRQGWHDRATGTMVVKA
ncbi:MAG: RDD family protein [bacterium]|nr:RDD family protein [bacterium]MDE0351983.1 RDD family protein [bacterium]